MPNFKLRKNKIFSFLTLLEKEYRNATGDKLVPKNKRGTTNFWKNLVNEYYNNLKLTTQKRIYDLSVAIKENQDWRDPQSNFYPEDDDLFDSGHVSGADYVVLLKHLKVNELEYGKYISSDQLLENFETHRWFFYYYDSYKDEKGVHEGIGRAVVVITNTESKEVFLHNKIEKQGNRSHSNYKGTYNIYEHNSRFLEMNLKTSSENKKDMTVLIDIGESNKCELAIGMFHNLSDGYSIFSKNVIIEKIDNLLPNLKNEFVFFEEGSENYTQIDPSIRSFFKIKSQNKLKSPNKHAIYNLVNLSVWVSKKAIYIPAKRNEKLTVYLTSSILYNDYERLDEKEAKELYMNQLALDKSIKAELENLGCFVNYLGENKEKLEINNQIYAEYTNSEIRNSTDKADILMVLYPDFSLAGRPISIIFEIGYLISRFKKLLIFYPTTETKNLPLLLRGALCLNSEVKNIEYHSNEDLIRLIKLNLSIIRNKM